MSSSKQTHVWFICHENASIHFIFISIVSNPNEDKWTQSALTNFYLMMQDDRLEEVVKCHLTLFSSPRVFVLSWLLEEEITFILRHCTQGLFVLIMPVSKQNNMVKWWQTREDVAVAVSMVRANWSFFNSTSICDLFTCDYKLPHRHVYYRKVPRDTFKKKKTWLT